MKISHDFCSLNTVTGGGCQDSPSGLLPPCEDPVSWRSVSSCRSCESYRQKPDPETRESTHSWTETTSVKLLFYSFNINRRKVKHAALISKRVCREHLYDISKLKNTVEQEPAVTVQNWMPLTLLPSLSSGGDQHMMPITFGTTSRIPPATPDLAGRPT